MITGITPLDSAYSYAGYVVAGQLMKKLLPVYIGVVASATIWIIYKGLLEQSLKPVIIYLITVGILSAFFIPTQTVSCSSAAGQAGAPLIVHSETIASSLGYNQSQPIPSGLGLIGMAINNITTWTVQGIEDAGNLAKSDKYIGGSPFSAIYTDDMILTAHITSLKTKIAFINFLKGPFTRAITQWKNSGAPPPIHSPLWYPGTWDKKNGPKKLKQWESIKKEIIKEGQQKYGKFNWWGKFLLKYVSCYDDTKNFDNAYIGWVTNNEIRDDSQGTIGQLTKNLGTGESSTVMTNMLGRIIRFISKLILQLLAGAIIPALPVFQGAISFIVLSFFPIVFLISLFPSSFSWISWYFLIFFWVQSWSIGWAILNVFQNLQWAFFKQIFIKIYPSFVSGGMPFINNTTFITIPLVTLILIFIMPAIEWELLSKGRAAIMSNFTNISAGGKIIDPAIRI